MNMKQHVVTSCVRSPISDLRSPEIRLIASSCQRTNGSGPLPPI